MSTDLTFAARLALAVPAPSVDIIIMPESVPVSQLAVDIIGASCVRSPWARAPFLAAPDYSAELAPAPYGAPVGGVEHVGRSVGEAPAPLKRKRARKGARPDGVTPAMADGLAFLRRCNRMLARWIDRAADIDGKRRASVWGGWLTGSPGHRCYRGADTWGPSDGGAIEHRAPRWQDRSAARLWQGLAAVAQRACRTETDAAEAVSILWGRLADGGEVAFPIAFAHSAARRHERTRERRAAARRAARDAVAAGYLAAASDPQHAVMIAKAEAQLGETMRALAHLEGTPDADGESARTMRRRKARLLADLERDARAIIANS